MIIGDHSGIFGCFCAPTHEAGADMAGADRGEADMIIGNFWTFLRTYTWGWGFMARADMAEADMAGADMIIGDHWESLGIIGTIVFYVTD